MRFDNIVDAIGNTPLVRLHLPSAARVYAKLELQNPFSMKDRAARNIIQRARQTGELAAGAPIVESSSGSMALGLAVVGRRLGHDVHIVTDPRIDSITLTKLRSLGCVVHIVSSMTGNGWQSARLERLAELRQTLPGAFWAQQYGNPDNPAAYDSLADELLADLDRVDVLVGSVGSGGSLCGTARALRRAGQQVRVVGVDAVGSVLFDQPDRPGRLQSGLGNSLRPLNLDRSVVDEVHWLNDRESFAGAARLAAEQQIFGGNTSGSVYQVVRWIARGQTPGVVVVAIMPDRGDRYVDSVFDADYHSCHGLDRLPETTEPPGVAYGTEVATWSYSRLRRTCGNRIAFIESNTTGSGMLALTAAREMGLRPVLYTGDPDRYHGLAATGADVVRCDTGDLDALRACLGSPDGAAADLAGITTTSDFYLPAVATLATGLGLPATPPPAVASCRDKALTRQVLHDAGIRQPAFAVVRSLDQVGPALARTGLPCVVKPVDDSGSHLVRRCEDRAAVEAHLHRILTTTHNVRGQPAAGAAVVERYLPGRELSLEAFVVEGGAEVVGITAKQVGFAPYFVEVGHRYPAVLAPAEAERLNEVGRGALAALGYRWGPAHVELIVEPDGEVAVVEVNARLAGGMIPELVRLASGVDLLRQQILAATGDRPDLTTLAHRHAGIAFVTTPVAGRLAGVDGLAAAAQVPGIAAVRITRPLGELVQPPASAYDRLGHLIAVADTPADVDAALAAAQPMVRLAVEPAGVADLAGEGGPPPAHALTRPCAGATGQP